MDFRSRKEQIEKDFARRLFRSLRIGGTVLTFSQKKLIKEELRGAAMVGAAEERHRTLELLKRFSAAEARAMEKLITDEGVLSVLGYK